MSNYDSTQDTLNHIRKVQTLLVDITDFLTLRGIVHDASKLDEPEKLMYDKFTPKLRETTYGSDEYQLYLEQMGTALKHHYENNSHHPEHFQWGIHEMSLLDLIEMFCDWKAASLRHYDGSMADSIDINAKRFGIEDQLFHIFRNTMFELDW